MLSRRCMLLSSEWKQKLCHLSWLLAGNVIYGINSYPQLHYTQIAMSDLNQKRIFFAVYCLFLATHIFLTAGYLSLDHHKFAIGNYIPFLAIGKLFYFLVFFPNPVYILLILLLEAGYEYIRYMAFAAQHAHGIDGVYLGMGLAVDAVFLLSWSRLKPSIRTISTLMPGFVLMCMQVLLMAMPVIFYWLCIFAPVIFDENIILFKRTLGVSIGSEAAKFAQKHAEFAGWAGLMYLALPLAMIILHIVAKRSLGRDRSTFDLIAAFGIALLFTALYYFFPACGPRVSFGTLFPDNVARFTDLSSVDVAHCTRNAMPSLHAVWGLVVFLFALNFQWFISIPTGLFTALMLFATVGSGEHYITDLVVALPVVLIVMAVCLKGIPRRMRYNGIALGTFQLGFWFWLLLSGIPFWLHLNSAWAGWVLFIVTGFLSFGYIINMRRYALKALKIPK